MRFYFEIVKKIEKLPILGNYDFFPIKFTFCEKKLCAFCVHMLYFFRTSFDIMLIIFEALRRARVIARALRMLKNKKSQKNPKKWPIFFEFFFSKFIFLCLMCANNTINYFEAPYTMKSSKKIFFWIPMKFDDFNVKSCQNLKNSNFSSVILNFWKK